MSDSRPPAMHVTVDVAIIAATAGTPQLLLVERKYDPFAGRYAFPGGFVELDEDVPAGAARELEEETGVRGVPLLLFGVFGRPGRDPRGRTVSAAYVAVAPGSRTASVRAGDDAARAEFFPLDALPRPLAFDHDEIAAALLAWLREQRDVHFSESALRQLHLSGSEAKAFRAWLAVLA